MVKTTHVRVYGIVQGVGFRPTVSRHAITSGVTGSVSNKGPYVEIFLQGDATARALFVTLLKKEPPKRAVILKMDEEEIAMDHVFTSFDIIESSRTKGEIYISPDIAICDECAKELYDPHDRRYLHPFINCTCCGPRLTILDALPYDRERTSMKDFPMCPACAQEYYDPESRRYDAQPVACHDCGPRVKILDEEVYDQEAIKRAREVIRQGGIVGIKGIGGFHLCCDGTNEAAVTLLRQRKNRPGKPFALMMKDLDTVYQYCLVPEGVEEILTGYQKPILLLPENPAHCVAKSVAPDHPRIGVMLPYTPLHMLLFDNHDGLPMTDVFVMTSGNMSGAPICHNDEEARKEMAYLCDLIITHDRTINIRCDDSVMDLYHNAPYMIRRSRGYAPLPSLMPQDFKGVVLGIGGELKNTFTIGVNQLLYPSSYIGDLGDLRSVAALKETITRYEKLLEVTPEVVCCDLHPRYNSRMVAHELGLPVIEIQHHYSHILTCMAENAVDQTVIGVSFDGTGYGTDGTIWGGEIMIADLEGFTRKASIRPFTQIGGDASSLEGWRNCVSMLADIVPDPLAEIERLHVTDKMKAQVVLKMKEKGLNCVTSTSVGRLFDSVSALFGIRESSTFEAEASSLLQFTAESFHGETHLLDGLKLYDEEEELLIMNTDGLFARLLDDSVPVNERAYAFHLGLAKMAAATVVAIAKETGVTMVALSGGCYQNTLLLELTEDILHEADLYVLTHHLIPPNDGGISLGQAYKAMYELNKKRGKEECV